LLRSVAASSSSSSNTSFTHSLDSWDSTWWGVGVCVCVGGGGVTEKQQMSGTGKASIIQTQLGQLGQHLTGWMRGVQRSNSGWDSIQQHSASISQLA
jgi:hypothetical protein